MIEVLLLADVKVTEKIEAVQEAIQNVCPIAEIKIIHDTPESTLIQGKATGQEAIFTLSKKFREQRILEAVRQSLLKNIENNCIKFGIYRQAALVNRIHICDIDERSAMGPIKVEICAKNIRDVIDYISPPTSKGKPQFRKDLKLE